MLQKSVQALCLILLLTVQVLAAQHATVHPVEAPHSGFSQTGHHDSHGDADDKDCGLCDFLAAVSHGVMGPAALALTVLAVIVFVYKPLFSQNHLVQNPSAAYFAQAPPALFS